MLLLHRFLVGLLFLCGTTLAHAGTGPDAFVQELASVHEAVYVSPRASLRRLDALQAGRGGTELGQLLVEQSRAYFWLGDKDKAAASAQHAEKLGREAHDDALVARALLARAYVLSMHVHDQETARQLIQQAGALAGKVDDVYLQAQALVTQGQLAEEEGRTEDSLELVTRATGLAREGANPDALIMALRERSRLLAGAGRDDEALAAADELVALAKARGIPAQLARARLAEYATAARAGRARRAETALQAAVDLLEKLEARESLAIPLANLAELYIQGRRFGEAWRAANTALRISRELGDEYGIRLASFQLGMTDIYFRNIAKGRATVDQALASFKNDDRYVPMLLDYGHALSQVGEGDAALTVYKKAGSVSLAAWHKERQLSYESLQRAYAYQKKQNELARLHHESALKASDLRNTRRQRSLWVALSATACVAIVLVALLYRRVKKTNKLLHAKNEQLFLQSTRDSLTGLFNRHYFYQEVVPVYHGEPAPSGSERRARGEIEPGGARGGTFLLMDIDHFKSINDRFGHGAGDAVLKTVAARLKSVLREEDFLIRWGGEEFLAWLPGLATNEARQVCERLLAAVSSTPIDAEGQALTVTTSIGFCPKPEAAGGAEPGWEALVHLADLCLYLAKTAGRNQAFGVLDANVLTPEAIAKADADLKQASLDGVVELVNVKS